MPNKLQSSEPLALCGQCGTLHMRIKPQWSLLDRFFVWTVALYPFVCLRCCITSRSVRVTWRQIITLTLIAGLVGGAYFVRKRYTGGETQTDMLARTRSSVGGELSAFEKMMLQKPKQTLDNAGIVQLWKANVNTDVILRMIRSSNTNFDVSANSVIQLKQAGVDQTIILAMVDASFSNR